MLHFVQHDDPPGASHKTCVVRSGSRRIWPAARSEDHTEAESGRVAQRLDVTAYHGANLPSYPFHESVKKSKSAKPWPR